MIHNPGTVEPLQWLVWMRLWNAGGNIFSYLEKHMLLVTRLCSNIHSSQDSSCFTEWVGVCYKHVCNIEMYILNTCNGVIFATLKCNYSTNLTFYIIIISIGQALQCTLECISKGIWIVCSRAIATGTAGTAMAVPLFDKTANEFERILFLFLDLPRSMYLIHIPAL